MATSVRKPRILKDVDRSLVAGAAICDMLRDDTRMRLCYLLATNGPLNVGTLVSAVGMEQPAVSHHLKLLKQVGIVSAEPQGKHRVYSLLNQSVSSLVVAFAETPTKPAPKPRKTA